MTNSNFTIGQRVAKSENSLGYKVGAIKDINGSKALVDYDNHANRWVSVKNLEEVS